MVFLADWGYNRKGQPRGVREVFLLVPMRNWPPSLPVCFFQFRELKNTPLRLHVFLFPNTDSPFIKIITPKCLWVSKSWIIADAKINKPSFCQSAIVVVRRFVAAAEECIIRLCVTLSTPSSGQFWPAFADWKRTLAVAYAISRFLSKVREWRLSSANQENRYWALRYPEYTLGNKELVGLTGIDSFRRKLKVVAVDLTKKPHRNESQNVVFPSQYNYAVITKKLA